MFAIGSFNLTEEEVRKRKDYLGITAEDEVRLREVHAHLQAYSQEIADRFYEFLLSHPHTRAMLSEPGLIDRLKQLQKKYFSELTAGTYDIEYFENRLRVGQTHNRVGLAPEWYLGAYNKYLQIVSDVLSRAFKSAHARYLRAITSVTKIIYLDMSLALDAYILSAQERLEQQNEAIQSSYQKLRQLQGDKQQLTDMIVHDLQNPLAGIIAYLELLKTKPDGLTLSEREALEEALRRCGDLVNMILNVLQVGRGEEGKLAAHVELTNLAELARESVAAFRIVAEVDGRRINEEIPPSVIVRSDQMLIRRILYNLIRNALRHTPRGTEVLVRLEVPKAGSARLSVIDNGPGVPPEIQPLLFERYGAAALRNAGLRVDSGLGLAFCKTAADALGAALSVQSDGSHGTAFALTIPTAEIELPSGR